MALETAITDEIADVNAALDRRGASDLVEDRLRTQVLTLAALSAIYEELVAQTALLTTIASNTTP